MHYNDLGCHLGELVWNEDSDVEGLRSPREHQRYPELLTHLVAPDKHHVLEELAKLTQLRVAQVLHGHHISRCALSTATNTECGSWLNHALRRLVGHRATSSTVSSTWYRLLKLVRAVAHTWLLAVLWISSTIHVCFVLHNL